jgi:peptide/nickel transport system permease protein
MNMVEKAISSTDFSEAPPRVSELRRFRRVFFQRPFVAFGLVVFAILIFIAIFATWLAPYNPYKQDLPNAMAQPSSQHWLGTDTLGRDTLSRLMYGSRTALTIGFITVAVSSIIGMTLGMLAGYFGGVTNMVIMRVIDAIMPFPMILLALLIASLLGGGIKNVIVALSVATIAPYARVMNGVSMSVRENDYIMAEKAMGSGHWRVMLSHILPNAIQPLIVMMTMQLGSVILAEASLSFLGIGITPPGAAWGAMVNDGYRDLLTNPVLSIAPGLAIMFVVFAFNMIGDGLRDALDPRLRGRL